MATTLPGSPYVESSDLVANYPAVSEALAERVDLVGVLPFADAAARTTALPTPTDGQYSYLQDTNSTEYYNGTAWVAAGVAPGLVHLNTTTFSAVSSVSINNVFSSTYDNYAVVMNILTTASSTGSMRFRASGTDNTSTNYTAMGMRIQASDTDRAAGTMTTSLVLQNGVWQANYNFYRMDIFNPNRNIRTGFTSLNSAIVVSTSLAAMNIFSGQYQSTDVFDGFTIITSSGNISGDIRVYGYKKS